MRAHIEPEELKSILTPAELAEIPVSSLGIITRKTMALTILRYEREARYDGIKRSRKIAAKLKAVMAGAMAPAKGRKVAERMAVDQRGD